VRNLLVVGFLRFGSKFVNGSVRPLIKRFCKPREYLGST